MRSALEKEGIDPDAVQLIEDTSRETANALMRLNRYVDVLIPRGGAGLIRSVVENSTVPVIETGTGNCHIYVDSLCDLDMAAKIVYNAKCSRPSVCNAVESLLVHKDVAELFLPYVKEKLDARNVEIRGCERTAQIIPCVAATEEDFYTEFLDYVISVKIVDSLDDAIDHINEHGTKHSECIVTSSYENSREFLARVDAAAVYVNASTRFTDGGEFGLGAEIGISTQKLHARGPMGLNELTTVKYCVYGSGQVR
jgi:glutamate-5-semialdehyde dehydrogenase